MNFEVFNTQDELDDRVMELMGVAREIVTDYAGGVFTLKWR